MPQHLGALIIVTNYILLSALFGGCIVVAAGSVTTTVLCSGNKIIGFYDTEMLAAELS